MGTSNASSMMSLILIVSVTHFCLTRPSHALSLRQKLIDLGTSVNEIKGTLENATTDLHEKLIQVNDTVNEKLIEITDTMHVKLVQISGTIKGKAIQITEKLDRITGTLDEVITATACPETFIRFEASCYYFSDHLPSHGGDQSYARSQCEIKGAKLVSIETKQEAVFLYNQTLTSHYWTSAHRHVSYWVWEATGMNVTDGYQPWASSEPNQATYYCANFHGGYGKLYDWPCSKSGWRYICETKIPSFL